MLRVLLDRVRPAKLVSEWVVATSTLPQDDAVQAVAETVGVACFRGHPEDCLDRYYQAARRYGAAVIVRITGDNPLVDHEIVDWVVGEFMGTCPPCDYATNGLSDTFPLGLAVEVFKFESLARAWREDKSHLREHVTPYIYSHPQKFCIRSLNMAENCCHFRWTVDTPADLEFVRRVFDFFDRYDFTWEEALKAVQSHPEWVAINAHVFQRTI
jgi:spore coat polysaccharide biosynthesis protein SpsF